MKPYSIGSKNPNGTGGDQNRSLGEPLEIEVKFYLPDIESIRKRILGMGATCLGRHFETNIRFEDDQHSLIQRQCLLRLRKDRVTTLTFKSKPREPDGEFKVFRELEVEVSDFAAMQQILESLGFHPEQVYEKWRETWRLNDTLMCIDSMPYGDFLEIEGRREDIRRLTHALDLCWEDRIILNYLGMFDILRQRLNLAFSDLTFSNFASVRMNMADHLHRFRV